MFEQLIQPFLVFFTDLVHTWGYLGILVFSIIEASFIPLPSEVTMLPVALLIHSGKLALWPSVFAIVIGTTLGACLNYVLARTIGRVLGIALIERFGKYVFLKKKHVHAAELFFEKHGELTTYIGRLLPVFKHVISLPAGFAKMNIWRFIAFSFVGSFTWTCAFLSLVNIVGTDNVMKLVYIIAGFLVVFAIGGYLIVRKITK